MTIWYIMIQIRPPEMQNGQITNSEGKITGVRTCSFPCAVISLAWGLILTIASLREPAPLYLLSSKLLSCHLDKLSFEFRIQLVLTFQLYKSSLLTNEKIGMGEIAGTTASGQPKYCLSSTRKWNWLALHSWACGGYHNAQGAIQMSPFPNSCHRKKPMLARQPSMRRFVV